MGEEGRIWRSISGYAALFMTLAYILFVLNYFFNFIPLGGFLDDFVTYIIYYGPMVICATTATATIAHRGLIARIVVLAIWVAIFLFSFFPDVFFSIIEKIKG